MAAYNICTRFPHNDDTFPIKTAKILCDTTWIFIDPIYVRFTSELQAVFGGWLFVGIVCLELSIEYVAEISVKKGKVHTACPMQGLAFH